MPSFLILSMPVDVHSCLTDGTEDLGDTVLTDNSSNVNWGSAKFKHDN